MATYSFEWRGGFDNRELNVLHAEAFNHTVLETDWVAQVDAHSLGWVTVRDGGALVGFVNIAWDGGIHAFLIDTMVRASAARQGVGTALVARAAREARARGCLWLHADFAEEHRPFYIDACGFQPTSAALLPLDSDMEDRGA